LVDAVRRAQRTAGPQPGRRGGFQPRHKGRGRGRASADRRDAAAARGPGARPAPRPVVVDRLDRAGLLPAIVFIFSRAGCEAAVTQTLAAGIRLTTAAEAATIREVVEHAVAAVPAEDLSVLGYDAWATALERGVAAHHAGLLPVFKETVEQLFAAGLVKVVYATETLALGINMPARSVVLERLVKWNGSAHVALTPGEYTQLTGRAGRRGIDVEGHAVVLYSEGIDPVAVAGLASRRTYPLRSAFHPTYNMAVNLLATMPRARAREVLELSFAQFQADRGVVGLAKQARKQEEALAGYAQAMTCHLGDFTEYLELRQEVSRREGELSRERSAAQRRDAARSMTDLRRGTVVAYRRGRRTVHGVVLASEDGGFDGPRVQLLTDERQVRWLGTAELPAGVQEAGQVKVRKGFNPRNPAERRDLASSLRNAITDGTVRPDDHGGRPGSRASTDTELTELRRRLRAHPCHGCSEREDHARWANRWLQLREEHEALLGRIQRRTGSVAQDFDHICALLTELGYLRPDEDGELRVTDHGRRLSRLYAEKDLVLAESLRSGAWDKVDAAELAAVVSATVYSARGDEIRGPGPMPGGWHGRLGQALTETLEISTALADLEDRHGVPRTDPVDPGLVGAVHEWAMGAELSDVLLTAELGAGDFVRWCKQVLDVLDQLAVAASSTRMRERARDAMDLVRRGVVAWSSV
ncbi:helicase-related protein, partial [Georgenia sp. 10Sc9-8]|nr:helicase-related protein [Georgenia halotolerans]